MKKNAPKHDQVIKYLVETIGYSEEDVLSEPYQYWIDYMHEHGTYDECLEFIAFYTKGNK